MGNVVWGRFGGARPCTIDCRAARSAVQRDFAYRAWLVAFESQNVSAATVRALQNQMFEVEANHKWLVQLSSGQQG